MRAFGARLAQRFAERKRLCVGIDPHTALLAEWGLTDDAAGAERMGRAVVEAAAEVAVCVKPQVAFFERFGASGFAALERVLADARDAGLLVIADVKRGDIGSSFDAYAEAWLAPGSPLESDAMTAHAFHGFGSLTGALRLVREHGKGLFVLAATSNPEAAAVQLSQVSEGRTLAAHLVSDARAANAGEAHSALAVGSVGVVLGATVKLSDYGLDLTETPAAPMVPILAPGFGFQGARIEDVEQIFGALTPAVLASESRSVLAGGAAGLAERIRQRAETVAAAFDRTTSEV